MESKIFRHYEDSRSSFEADLFFGIYDDLSWEYDKLPNEYNFDFSFFENN